MPGSDPEAKEASFARAQRSASATALWVENCAKCHGDNAEGGGAGTPSLNTREKFDQKWDRPFFDAIKNGVPDKGMEAYGETMTDAQIWALVVHIRELQARALRSEFGSPRATNGVYRSQHQNFRMEEVVPAGAGLRTPWGLDWLPDGRMLITNRPGTLHVHSVGKPLVEVQGLPPIVELGQGGLMEVAVHPNYRQNGWVYLAYTDPARSGDGGMTKIVRGKLRFSGDSATWTDQQTIYEAEQKHYSRSGLHFGSRIVFDKGKLFFVVGERGTNMGAQQLDTPWGKIHRVNDDGSIPADNPYVNTPNAIKSIWSIGHRNPQGMVMGLDGNLWVTEHGPRGGDEVNRIQRGANYGWPVVAFSINYNDAPFRTPWPTDGLQVTQPIFRWIPSTGASGLDVARGNPFTKWRGDLIAGGLAGNNVDRIRTRNGQLVEREEILHGIGRVRDVSVGPDGFIYLAINGRDRIVRLVPAP